MHLMRNPRYLQFLKIDRFPEVRHAAFSSGLSTAFSNRSDAEPGCRFSRNPKLWDRDTRTDSGLAKVQR